MKLALVLAATTVLLVSGCNTTTNPPTYLGPGYYGESSVYSYEPFYGYRGYYGPYSTARVYYYNNPNKYYRYQSTNYYRISGGGVHVR